MQITPEQYKQLESAINVFRHDGIVRTLLALAKEPKNTRVLETELNTGLSSSGMTFASLREYLTKWIIPAGYSERIETPGKSPRQPNVGYKLSPNIPKLVLPWAIYHTGFVTSRGLPMSKILGDKGSSSESAAIRRMKLLNFLRDGPKQRKEIDEVVGGDNLSTHFDAFSDLGFISYGSFHSQKCAFAWNSERDLGEVQTVKETPLLTPKVARAVKEAGEEGIVAEVIAKNLEITNTTARYTIPAIISGLVRQGLVKPLTFSKRTGLSKAEILVKGMDFVDNYITPFAQTFLGLNQDFRQRQEYTELASNPEKLREAMNQMLSTYTYQSRRIHSRTPRLVAKTILETLYRAGGGGLFSTDLYRQVGLTRGSAAMHIRALKKSGNITIEPKGKRTILRHVNYPIPQ